jgi:hypothetical protein
VAAVIASLNLSAAVQVTRQAVSELRSEKIQANADKLFNDSVEPLKN